MESPIHAVGLHGVRQAFDIKNGLVELHAVGEYVIGRGEIRVVRSAEVQTAFQPAIDFDAAVFPSLTVRSRVEGLHQRGQVGVGYANDGSAAVGPVGVWKRRRIERRRRCTAGRFGPTGSGSLPILRVSAEQALQKSVL